MERSHAWEPTVDPGLAEDLESSTIGSSTIDGFQAAVAYAHAMIAAQALEVGVKLVTPAFDAPTTMTTQRRSLCVPL